MSEQVRKKYDTLSVDELVEVTALHAQAGHATPVALFWTGNTDEADRLVGEAEAAWNEEENELAKAAMKFSHEERIAARQRFEKKRAEEEKRKVKRLAPEVVSREGRLLADWFTARLPSFTETVQESALTGKDLVVDVTEFRESAPDFYRWMEENSEDVRSTFRHLFNDLVFRLQAERVGYDHAMRIVGLPWPAAANVIKFTRGCETCKTYNAKAHVSLEVWKYEQGRTAFIRLKESDSLGHSVVQPRVLRPGSLTRENLIDYIAKFPEEVRPYLIKRLAEYFTEPSGPDESKKFDEETFSRAQALSRDPTLLAHIRADMDRSHVGDDRVKVLALLLLASSRLKGKEQSVIIKKTSSAGGSNLLRTVTSYFDNVISYTRVTSAAPDRIGGDFTGKILKIEELSGAQSASTSLRVMLSEGNLKLLTTEKDENGNIRAVEMETRGTPSFATTTIDYQIESQMLNRVWPLSLDETVKQTASVVERQFGRYDWEGHDFEPDPAIRCLLSRKSGILDDQLVIIIPYWEKIAKAFPTDSISARRDSYKFATLIALCAWLHQHQRPVRERDGKQYLLATIMDFRIVQSYAKKALASTLTKLDERMLRALEVLEERVKINPDGITYAEFGLALGIGKSAGTKLAVALDETGYVFIDTSQRTYTVRPSGKKPRDAIGEVKFTEQEALEWLRKGLQANTDLGRLALWVTTGRDPGATNLAYTQNSQFRAIRDDSSHDLGISRGKAAIFRGNNNSPENSLATPPKSEIKFRDKLDNETDQKHDLGRLGIARNLEESEIGQTATRVGQPTPPEQVDHACLLPGCKNLMPHIHVDDVQP
ncbi:MAG: hypothetical protein JRN51_08535 [Nitrososphaerota archaeon]|nr:hypothetical protein [Nitrososphaerota archaeon]